MGWWGAHLSSGPSEATTDEPLQWLNVLDVLCDVVLQDVGHGELDGSLWSNLQYICAIPFEVSFDGTCQILPFRILRCDLR